MITYFFESYTNGYEVCCKILKLETGQLFSLPDDYRFSESELLKTSCGKLAFIYKEYEHDYKLWNIEEERFVSDQNIQNLDSYSNENTVEDINRLKNENYGIFADLGSYDGDDSTATLHLYNLQTGELLLSTIACEGNEYLTYTPEGFFTGSNWACKNLVYIVDGLEVTELTQLYDKLHRPDLIAAKTRGEDISEESNALNFIALMQTGKEPSVSFRSIPEESKERKIKFEILVKDNGGGIGEVTLWRDGQSYSICSGYPSTAGQTVVISAETELFPPETKIEVSAYNRARTIESKRAETIVKWTGTVKRPNLFLLTIAVNDYYIDKYRLRCAVPDAKLVAETVEKYGGIFKSVRTDSLLDSEVTKDNFDKKFSEISASIDTDDVFILFFAGHGTEYDIDKTYYFLPYDCILTNKDKIPEQCISAGFIQKNLSKIKAQKKMIILDTCQSGSFTNKVATRDATADILILDRFKKSTGTATFMASSSEETAKEGYKGHGIFSYFIAEGLSGKADYDRDGYVRLKELENYLCSEVYKQSQKVFTSSQLPVIDSAGMDFVLSKTE